MQPIVRLSAIAAAIAATLAVAGCAEPPPPVIPTSQPSTAPVFATDADALAAAEKAYAGYLAASDLVAHGGGTQTDSLREWDTAKQFESDQRDFSLMRTQGHHTVGATTYSQFALQSFVVLAGKAELSAYVCLRIDKTTLLDSSGVDVGENRQLAIPLQVSFVSASAGSRKLLIDESDAWPGTDFCS